MEEFELIVQNTQAKYKIKKNIITQQSSYNLPKTLTEYIERHDIVTEYISKFDKKIENKHFMLNENYRFILSKQILALIKEDENYTPKFIYMLTT